MNYERNFYKMQGLAFNLTTIGTTLLNRFSGGNVTILGYNELLKICKLFSENTNLVEVMPETLNEKEKYYFHTIDREGLIFSNWTLQHIENKEVPLIDFDSTYNEVEIDFESIDWIPAYFVKEFWEIFEEFYGYNESEDEENMNEMETEMEYNCENTSNIKEICRTIAEDLLQNYESYENVLAAMNGFSEEDDETDVTVLATLFERLFK